MALVLHTILLLFLVYPLHVLAQEKGSNLIQPGSSLYSGKHPSSWASSSGHFEFGFYKQGDGFAVGIWLVSHPAENTVVWTANRDDPPISPNATLTFTREGDLLLHTGTYKEALINNSRFKESVQSASMLNTGNFVIYGNASDLFFMTRSRNAPVIWQSFDFPTDTILGGQNFSRGHPLFSSVSKSNQLTGQFFLEMQFNGNLVAYVSISTHDYSDSFWSTDTTSYSISKLNLNEKGSLVLFGYLASVKFLANSTRDRNNMSIYSATLDPDGIFRIYLHQFQRNINSSTVTKIWQNLNDTCDVKGSCGLNSYCSSWDADFECYCYPGFSFFDEKNKFKGCSQNFTFDACEVRKDEVMRYNVTTLENIFWDGNSYSETYSNKDDCKKSCQEDCSCGAALYSNDNCKKYSLPLKYGKRKVDMSSTAFIKLILGISPSPQSSPFQITDEGNKSLISTMGLSLGSVAGVCFVIAISSILIYRHRLQSYRKLLENDNSGLTEQFALQFFSFSELEKATDGFKDELGRGTFGTVFKGVLPGDKENKAIAVNKLENSVYQGEREFRTEMTAIGRTNHKNLVRLLGFCVEGSRKFLVYEYLSKGSLANFLFNSNERPTWNERIRIALGVAKGILYLHEECELCIIHCQIKPQNILFDDSMTAKISDFGLGKLRPNQTTTTAGKRAAQYLAPECQKNALLSVKIDVYSYGVILLELICCKNSLELQMSNADEILLSGWVYNCLVSGELNKLLVVEGEEVDMKMLERFVKVGLWCIQDDPNLRRLMKNVTLMLEGTMAVSVPPSPSLSHTTN